MADLKISQLTALTAAGAASTDVVPVVDTDAATTKKISLSELVDYVVASAAFSGAVSAMAPSVDFDDADNVICNMVFN